MFFKDLWTCLHNAHHAIKLGSLEKQDETINALFRFLDSRRDQYYPVFLYKSAIWLLHWYLKNVLPAVDYYEEEDCQIITEDYKTLIKNLNESMMTSQTLDNACEGIIEHIRNGTFRHIHEIAEALMKIARNFFHPQVLKGFQKPFGMDHPFQEHLDILRENFRYDQAAEFFAQLFDTLLEDSITTATFQYRLHIHNFKRMFGYVLESYFQGKAVLVDNFQQGQVMPTWVTVDCDQTCEHVEFWNQEIDAKMQVSADSARHIARQYLLNECGREVPKNLFVQCQFSSHEANLKDTSASLLFAIRIVGEILGVKSKPATVVTGEVGRSGEVLGVGFINEKIEAANKHEGIEWIVVPEANVPEINSLSPPPNLPHQGGGISTEHPPGPPQGGNKLTVIPVRTFAEAVQQVLDHHREDWGEAPDVNIFYGRTRELEDLQSWILHEHCRLVAILGMGGIGKTTLTRKLTDQIKNRFQYVFWRDLRNAPPARHILGDCIKFLSDQQCVDLPQEMDRIISLLITYLKKHRCLLVLDNLEAVLQGGEEARTGLFLKGYEDYGTLIQRAGEIEHQSCLVLGSREKPRESAVLEGKTVRSFLLHGLESIDAEKLLKDLQGTTEERTSLIDHYTGHPLALKLVAATIRDVFHRDIAMFFAAATPLFINIKALLEEQYNRLSKREQELMYWLAIEREAVSLPEIQGNMVSPVSRKKLPTTLESLQQKSLLEKTLSGFTLQPVVMEYFTELIIEHVCKELTTGTISLFNSHTLMKAQAKDYIRQTQIHFLFKPIIEHLFYEYELSKQHIELALKKILAMLRGNYPRKAGYTGGNAINLLVLLNGELRNNDFSNLSVWQAYLQNINVFDVNLANADLAMTVFTETFGNVLSVAFSPDGELLAAGTTNNDIRVWQVRDGKQLFTYEGHSNWVWSIEFSSDGKKLASGSKDETVRLWDVQTGKCLRKLAGHSDAVRSVVFSPDNVFLASSSDDCTVRLWDVHTGEILKILTGYTQSVTAIAFSPDGKMFASNNSDYNSAIQLWTINSERHLSPDTIDIFNIKETLFGHIDRVASLAFSSDSQTLVSGSDDQTVRVWDLITGQCLTTLRGHTNLVKSVVFSPDDQTVASGSDDYTVRIWDVRTGQCLKTLQGHLQWVWSVAFSPDGKVLASGGSDQTVRLWEVQSGQCLKTFQGYTNRALSIAFNSEGSVLAAGYSDHVIWLWDIEKGQAIRALKGHQNWVMSIAFSPNGKMCASGSSDGTVRVWDVDSGKCLKIFQGHKNQVRSVVFSPDGNTLLSGGYDRTICLWNFDTGQCSHVFKGHTDWILSIALNSNGKIFASGSEDQTVRLWDICTGSFLSRLDGHSGRVWSVAFSPDGRLFASGSGDQSIRIWDVRTGKCLNTLNGHSNQVRSVTFSPDAQILASGSEDQTVRLWDVSTGTCLKVLQGQHTNWIWAVVFSPDGQILTSASEDGTIRLWDVQTGDCFGTLRPDRPYERMNIAGVTGLSEAQKATLKALGAVER